MFEFHVMFLSVSSLRRLCTSSNQWRLKRSSRGTLENWASWRLVLLTFQDTRSSARMAAFVITCRCLLLTIGRHMREPPDFLAELKELYTDDSIQESFFKYGGIIRHVLPYYPTYHKIIDEAAILAIDWNRYLFYLSRYISHFVSKYVVTPPHFRRVS